MRTYQIIMHNGEEELSPKLPALPNYDIKYIKDSEGIYRIPKHDGWCRVPEDVALNRRKYDPALDPNINGTYQQEERPRRFARRDERSSQDYYSGSPY